LLIKKSDTIFWSDTILLYAVLISILCTLKLPDHKISSETKSFVPKPITEIEFDDAGVPIGYKVGPKIESIIPTKNGHHLITKKFDVMKFKEKYPDIDIAKKNPTLLYYPNSLNPQDAWNIYTRGYSNWSSMFNTYQLQISLVENGTKQSSVTI
jgi:hypothetical protein